MVLGILITIIILLTVVTFDIMYPTKLKEGFDSLIIPAISPKGGYFATFVPRRGDVSIDSEEGGLIQNPRYFRAYVDIQRLGVEHDFCRMVEQADNTFFACALAGTENLSSTTFRTPGTKEGFRLSRDDYMRDINSDGRSDYCRILKDKSGGFSALCNRARDTDFDTSLTMDTNPPSNIQQLLTFYAGCVMWYRFRDDMTDYIGGTKLMVVGKGEVKENPPNPTVTEGLHFNGIDQYLRLGDNQDLELGSVIPLRSVRTFMIWVYFDEFTQNAHIIDFGDGSGKNNVVLGILGKGDESISDGGNVRRPLLCGGQDTVPTQPSGAQNVPSFSPQELMKSTNANVDAFTCEGFDEAISPRRLPPSRVIDKVTAGKKETATLLYEVWDQQQRKMRIKIPSVIPKRKWTHITVTAKSMDAFRPDIGIYINGEQVFLESSGFLPQTSSLSNCYIGKSNWTSDTSQYETRDELFKGSIFDLRIYKTPMSDSVIQDSVAWGKDLLGIV